MNRRDRQHTFWSLVAVAACALGACRARALDEADAGGSGGAMIMGAGGAAQPAGAAGTGATTTAGQGGGAGAIPGGPGAGGSGGAGGASANACAGGAAFSYLVRSLATSGIADASVRMHGFDLDGRVSDGTAPDDCHVSDGMSPDGRAGIDNVIRGFWREDFESLFHRSYAQGHFPLVVRLSGVDDFGNDDCVDVEWFTARWVGSPIDPASLSAVGTQLREGGPVARLAGARIQAGHLLANGDRAIELRASIDGGGSATGFVLPLALSRISFAPNVVELTGGELGGRVQPEDVHRAYQSVFGSLISRDQIASILFPDLPSGQTPCAVLSAGFGFEAVRVTVVP
jgi:hypothetical protein